MGGIIVRDSIGGEQFQYRTSNPIPEFSRVLLFRKAPADGTFTVTLGLAGYGEALFDDLRVEVVEQDDRVAAPDLARGSDPARPMRSPRPPDQQHRPRRRRRATGAGNPDKEILAKKSREGNRFPSRAVRPGRVQDPRPSFPLEYDDAGPTAPAPSSLPRRQSRRLPRWRRSARTAAPALGFITSDSVALLNGPDQLIALAGNHIELVIRQLAPRLLTLPLNFFQSPLTVSQFIGVLLSSENEMFILP